MPELVSEEEGGGGFMGKIMRPNSQSCVWRGKSREIDYADVTLRLMTEKANGQSGMDLAVKMNTCKCMLEAAT